MSALQIQEEFTVRVCYVTLALSALEHTPTSLYQPTMLQDNMMQLSQLLLSGYQFSSARIPIEYVVVLRGIRLAVL